MAKVFISHRTKDIFEATRLAKAIRNAGHDVWLDDWNIEVGESIVGQIQKGLADANYVVLCLSTQGNLSNWISREWMSTLARQLNGQKVKLIPIRLTGGAPPAILADIRYADLAADWAKGLSELLRSIR